MRMSTLFAVSWRKSFGGENFVGLIPLAKTSEVTVVYLPATCDHLLRYGRNVEKTKYRLFSSRNYFRVVPLVRHKVSAGSIRRLFAVTVCCPLLSHRGSLHFHWSG